MVALFTWIASLLLLPISINALVVRFEISTKNIESILERLSMSSLIARNFILKTEHLLSNYLIKSQKLSSFEILTISFICSASLAMNLFSFTNQIEIPLFLSLLILFNIAAVPAHFENSTKNKKRA